MLLSPEKCSSLQAGRSPFRELQERTDIFDAIGAPFEIATMWSAVITEPPEARGAIVNHDLRHIGQRSKRATSGAIGVRAFLSRIGGPVRLGP
jgi:hypothetical protein